MPALATPTIDALLAENASLKARIATLESELSSYRSTTNTNGHTSPASTPSPVSLTPSEYLRYGRQLILPELGLPGQLRLKRTRALVVGLGGLGCPCALYLAGAGIGTLGLLDPDTVDSSNLHRQIAHSSLRVGEPKVMSAAASIRALNPHVNVIQHHTALEARNALDVIGEYDLVFDCTDHPAVRYLISDACVLLKKPVVSGSALRSDGQMVVLNFWGEEGEGGQGMCYRCLWPRPPPASSITSCGDGGVLGPVVGAVGTLMALEGIKIASGWKRSSPARLMVFSGGADEVGGAWRSVKLKGRKKECWACGESPGLTREGLLAGDYARFCGVEEEAMGLPRGMRLGVEEARRIRKEAGGQTLWLDIRDRTQFGITRLEGSVNIPYEEFGACGEGELPESARRLLEEEAKRDVVVLCRRGLDSQVVAARLKGAGVVKGEVKDVVGGTTAWARRALDDGIVEY